MKEINVRYFVPENMAELERLAGKPIGFKKLRSEHVEPWILMLGRGGEYEFIRQATNRDLDKGCYDGASIDKPLRSILAWVISRDNLEIEADGVLCSFISSHFHIYHPQENGYSPRARHLKKHKQWRQPAE